MCNNRSSKHSIHYLYIYYCSASNCKYLLRLYNVEAILLSYYFLFDSKCTSYKQTGDKDRFLLDDSSASTPPQSTAVSAFRWILWALLQCWSVSNSRTNSLEDEFKFKNLFFAFFTDDWKNRWPKTYNTVPQYKAQRKLRSYSDWAHCGIFGKNHVLMWQLLTHYKDPCSAG